MRLRWYQLTKEQQRQVEEAVRAGVHGDFFLNTTSWWYGRYFYRIIMRHGGTIFLHGHIRRPLGS